MNYFTKYLKYKKKYFNLKSQEKQYGGESKILQNILAIAKKQFYEEYCIEDEFNKSEIFKKITSLSEHKTVSHTPIEANWKEGVVSTERVIVNEKLIAHIYGTNKKLKKSAINKNLNEILHGLEENTIQIKFTWSSEFRLVFVNFFTTIIDEKLIEYVNYVYEPCSPEGNLIPEAPAYSYNNSTYIKPLTISPYQILSREFTNQIYEWIGRGTYENFICVLDTLNDNSELPLRFIYE
jgi:hypothetical protein